MSLPGRLRLRNTTRAMALPEHRSTNWDGRTNGNTSATDSKNSAFCFRIRICEHPREAARLNAAIPGPGTRTSRTIPVAADCSCLRDPAGFRTITTPPPHSVPASAHGVCCAACHSGSPRWTMALYRAFPGPRAPNAASPTDGARSQSSAAGAQPGAHGKSPGEPQSNGPPLSNLRPMAPDLGRQHLIPGFYPGLVKMAPENLFNNRQWRPRRPSTQENGDRPGLSAVPPWPPEDSSPSSPPLQTSSRPTG